MSETNEEINELNEVNEENEELIKEENPAEENPVEETPVEENPAEEIVAGDITTEQEAEPMEVTAEEENEVVMEEQKDTADEIMDVANDNDSEKAEEVVNEMEEQPQQNEEETNNMDVDTQEQTEVQEQPELQEQVEVQEQPEVQEQEIQEQPEMQENEENVTRVSSVRSSKQSLNSKRSSRASLGNNSKQSSKQKLNQDNNENNNENNNAKPSGGMIDKAFTEPISEQNEMRIYNGPIYCIEQVRIPPELPDIMKNYAKHIIRTQPEDVIIESYEYFKKLNTLRNSSALEEDYDDDNDKVKVGSISDKKKAMGNSNFSINSENNDEKNKNEVQLSPLELESFYERLLDFSEGNEKIPIADIRNMAEDANITQGQINEAVIVGSWDNDVEWLKFWALMVAGSCTNLKSTLQVIIDIIGDENIIPLKKIKSITEFLLESDTNSQESVVNDILSQLNEKEGEIIEKGELLDIFSAL